LFWSRFWFDVCPLSDWPRTENGFLLKAGEYLGKLLDSSFHGGEVRVFSRELVDGLSVSGITNPFILVKVFFLLSP